MNGVGNGYGEGYYSLRFKKIQSLDIILEHDIDEQYQYKPGETLRGYISLKLNESVKLKYIQVQIRGEGSVSWETSRRQKLSTKETYIDITETLVRSADGDSLALTKGVHEFPFYHDLPTILPSSYIGKYGSVTYVVRATLMPERKYGDPVISSEPFLVLRPLNLSLYPEKLMGYECDAAKRYVGICCISGKLNVKLNLNRTCFIPGEDIHVTAEIANGSPKLVTAVQVGVVMNSTFYAKKEMITNSQIISKKRDEWEMSIGEGRRWKDIRLSVPPYVPESNLDGCDLIDVKYDVLFQVEIHKGVGVNILLPLLIGTFGIPESLITIDHNGVRPGEEATSPKKNPLWRPIEETKRIVDQDPEKYEPLSDKEDSEIGSINLDNFSYGDDRFQNKNNSKKKRKKQRAPQPNETNESTNL